MLLLEGALAKENLKSPEEFSPKTPVKGVPVVGVQLNKATAPTE